MKTKRVVCPDCDDQIRDAMDMGFMRMVCVLLLLIFLDYWRAFLSLAFVGLTLWCEVHLFRWNAAQFVVVSGTFVLIGLSYIISVLSLDNKSWRARSTMELWRRRGGFRYHCLLAGGAALILVAGAAMVEYQPNTSVHWLGVIITLVLVPSIILAVGYLSNDSYHIQE
ncbi:MAG: hypothetical protein HZC01_01460 [Candidatus Kerfeldbacteria bacterium]|nr:hypothetical protein [Candidatus Kerfeldbacteria bacterium]